MSPVPVQIRKKPTDEEAVPIADLDDIASATVMLGCGDDNPYK
ncbi:hypothetical protein GCM10029978_091690 [Actinoallomurus acanthiterrae]